MSTSRSASERGVTGGVKFGIADAALDDGIEWSTIHIIKPGEFWIAVLTDEQASGLAASRPEGKLKRIGDRNLWFEPKQLF